MSRQVSNHRAIEHVARSEAAVIPCGMKKREWAVDLAARRPGRQTGAVCSEKIATPPPPFCAQPKIRASRSLRTVGCDAVSLTDSQGSFGFLPA